MVKGYLSTKFGINLLHGFWENGFYRRRTDDGRQGHDSSSAVQLHKTELKIKLLACKPLHLCQAKTEITEVLTEKKIYFWIGLKLPTNRVQCSN